MLVLEKKEKCPEQCEAFVSECSGVFVQSAAHWDGVLLSHRSVQKQEFTCEFCFLILVHTEITEGFVGLMSVEGRRVQALRC